MDHIEKNLSLEIVNTLKNLYDFSAKTQFLPNQTETTYFSAKKQIIKNSVQTISSLLKEMNFEFTLCSLKNTAAEEFAKDSSCPSCDGGFYA